MDITVLKPFTYGGTAYTAGQTTSIPDTDALNYINYGDASPTSPESVHRALIADATNALGVAKFAYDANGNPIGLSGPNGVIPLSTSAVSITSRDAMGRVTGYVEAGISKTVVYGQFGPASISGGGLTTTFTYDAAGFVTGVTTA
jgi:hypothetical protein